MLPLHIELKGTFAADSAAEVLRAIGEAAEGLGLPPVRSWEAPIGTVSGESEQGLSLAEVAARIDGSQKSAAALLAKVSRVGLSEEAPGRWKLWVLLSRNDEILGGSAGHQRALMALGRRLFAGGKLLSASLERNGGGVACVPAPPVAGYDRQLVVTTDNDVNDGYERPEAFWRAGWTVEEQGGRKLLTRCEEAVDSVDLLRAVRDAQWAMVRAARPKRTEYTGPAVEPDERPVYEEGSARLEPVGYVPSKQLVEYSCVLGAGQHVQGWEIYNLRSIVKKKKLPDGGQPVSTVRVVFLKQADAEGEKRPLLDVGVKVFYTDASGEIVEITA